MRQRRFLPSLSLLLAFEAVARHRSVTEAAKELHLTQSAVSRLIKTLEAQLGVELFIRQRKKLTPTAAALAYQTDLTRALDMIQRASMSLIANPEGGALSLAALPTFATRWLGPRLGRFLESHPGVSVSLATRIKRFSFETELFDERLTACASPAFLARNPVRSATDLAPLPLLQLETRATGWDDWFQAQNAAPTGAGGMLMDQFSMMIQAAISGLGVALLPDYLARHEIEEGRLAPILRPAVPGAGAYWLAWPEQKDGYAPLTTFRAWLSAQTRPPAPRIRQL